MPMTLPQEKRQWERLPRFEKIVYEFSDGWTVREATCAQDVHNIGLMLRNCWQGTQHYNPGYRKSMSLNDPAGIPRVAFILNRNGLISQPMGRNNFYVNEHLFGRLQEFAQAEDFATMPEASMQFHPSHPERFGDFVSPNLGAREDSPATTPELTPAGA